MKARLFSKVKKNETKFFDATTGQYQVLSAEERPEEELGIFPASRFTAPNGQEFIIVHGKREVRLSADTLTKETRVCRFRAEIVEE